MVNGTEEHEHGRRHPLVCCCIWFELSSYEILVSANGAHQPLFHGFVTFFNDILCEYFKSRNDDNLFSYEDECCQTQIKDNSNY
jgi:hypothetical protein